MNIQQAIEYMQKTKEELKALYPENAIAFDGSNTRSNIEGMVKEHVDYIQQPLAFVKAVVGRFDSDADAVRRVAAKQAKKGFRTA